MSHFKLSIWNNIHAITIVAAGLSYLFSNLLWTIYLAGLLLFGTLILISYNEWKSLKPLGGYANHLTLLRLLILLAIYFVEDPSIIFIMLVISIVLDAFDGLLARKFKTSSEFGSYLDIETDAFFMLILSSSLVHLGYADNWVIHAGLARYYYIILKLILGWTGKKEARINATRYSAIVVFVLYFSPFVLPHEYHNEMLITGTVILYASFCYSFYRLSKN